MFVRLNYGSREEKKNVEIYICRYVYGHTLETLYVNVGVTTKFAGDGGELENVLGTWW